MRRINFKSLAFHLLVPLMLFFIINMLMPDYKDYYEGLVKPAPSLPYMAFVAVWSLMYLLLGVGAYLAEQSNLEDKGNCFKCYFWMFLLSLFWLVLTFGLKWPFAGLLLTIVLLIMSYITYRKFHKINSISGKLFIPYLLWLLFLTYYTFGLWVLNSSSF